MKNGAAAFALDVGSGWKNLNVLDIATGSGAWGLLLQRVTAGQK